MVRAIGTDAFTESEEHWHGVPFEVLPLRTVRRAGRLRRQVQRPLEGYIHVPIPTTVVLRTVVDDRSIPCTPTGGLQVGPVVLPTNRDRRTVAA